MTPTFQTDDGRVQLWHGDCRDILPMVGKVDAVVTDPPYGLGERMQGGTWGSASKYADLRKWDIPPTPDELRNLLTVSGAAIVWGGNYFQLPTSRCWLIWDKQNAVPTMADVEMAWTNLDRPSKRKSLPVGVHSLGHPTQKPIPLMNWSLSFLNGSQVILDPYMGSGTTGIACIRTGRRFIGIEIDDHYFNVAKERIQRELRQQLLPL